MEAARETANELTKIYGLGIGVAGTGISGCGPAIALQVDITNRESVRAMLKQTVLAYGGIDQHRSSRRASSSRRTATGHVTDAAMEDSRST